MSPSTSPSRSRKSSKSSTSSRLSGSGLYERVVGW